MPKTSRWMMKNYLLLKINMFKTHNKHTVSLILIVERRSSSFGLLGFKVSLTGRSGSCPVFYLPVCFDYRKQLFNVPSVGVVQ